MAEIVPPRRDEFLTPLGKPTRRFMEFLEAMTKQTNTSSSVASSVADNSAIRAQLKALQQQVGSGNPLTSDETGFTVDTDKHTVDQDEA